MSPRALTVGVVAAALCLPTSIAGAAAGPETADKARTGWVAMKADWAKPNDAVTVDDVVAFGTFAYAVGNTTRRGESRPWVQQCRASKCAKTALPRLGKLSTKVLSVSGYSRGDMWAVGTARKGNHDRPVFWRKSGTRWSIFRSGILPNPGEGLRLTQVEVANASKAFAIGRYDYQNGKTSTLYRWNGDNWKEIAPRGDLDTFAKPCDGWFNRTWTDLVVRSGSAILVGRCSTTRKPAVFEQGDTTWEKVDGANFPTEPVFSHGSFVGQELWLTGQRAGSPVVYKRSSDRWSKVATKGLKGRISIADLAGPHAAKVMAVGSIATGHGHREAAAWSWGAGSWHITKIPAGVSRSRLVAVSVDGSGPFFAAGTDAARPADRRDLILRAK